MKMKISHKDLKSQTSAQYIQIKGLTRWAKHRAHITMVLPDKGQKEAEGAEANTERS